MGWWNCTFSCIMRVVKRECEMHLKVLGDIWSSLKSEKSVFGV